MEKKKSGRNNNKKITKKRKEKIKERERAWPLFCCEHNLERIGERGEDEIIKNLYRK